MIFDELDKEKIISSIENDPNLNTSDLPDIKSCVWILGKKYAQRDFDELSIIDIEKEFNHLLAAGTVDLIGRVNKPTILPPNSLGKRIAIDWKTSGKQDLDTSWKKYYVDSWQWKIYAWAEKIDYFEYRGISKTSGDTKEILIEVPKDNSGNVLTYLNQLESMRMGLQNSGFPWPQHIPYACGAYGKDCAFLDDCKKGKVAYGEPDNIPFHYTSSETFLLCPEKYRREALLEQQYGRDKVGSAETRFGSAVHRGMQEIYKQLKEKQNGISN